MISRPCMNPVFVIIKLFGNFVSVSFFRLNITFNSCCHTVKVPTGNRGPNNWIFAVLPHWRYYIPILHTNQTRG